MLMDFPTISTNNRKEKQYARENTSIPAISSKCHSYKIPRGGHIFVMMTFFSEIAREEFEKITPLRMDTMDKY